MQLTVHLAAVADTVYAYDANFVRNLVNHAVIPDPDTPIIFASGQFATARRARVCRKRTDRRNDAVVDVGGES